MIKRIFICSFILIMLTSFTGCDTTPPSIEMTEDHFKHYYDDIQKVVEFMINSGYQDININDHYGTMWADFNDITIENEAILDSIERIFKDGEYDNIIKTGNTISLKYWNPFMSEISCGVAYSINGIDEPEIEYCTELIPLSIKGWYYYVEDYNEWRLEN